MSFGYDDGTNTGGYGDDPTQQFGTPTSDGNEGSGPTAYEPGDDPSTQFGTPQSDQPGPTADDAGSPSDATQSFGSPTAWGDDAAPSTPPAQPRRSSADDYSYGPADPTQQFGTPYVSPQDYNNYFEDGGDNPVFNERQMRQDAAARGDLPQLPGAAEDTSNFNQASGWEANADQQTKSVMADDDSNRRAAYAPQPSNFDPDSELDPSQVIDWRGQQGPFRPGVPASERFGFEATDPTQMFGTPSNGEQTEFGPGDTRYDPPYTGGTAAGGAAKSVGLDENYQSTKAAADAIDVPGYKTEGASLHGEDSDLNRRWQDYVFGVENGMQEPDPQFEASIQGEANDLQSRFDDYRNRGAQYGQTFDAADTATGAYKDALDARAAQADQQGRADLQNFEDYSAIAQQPLGNQISPEQGGAIGAELLAGTRGSAVEGPPEPGMESLPDPNDPQAVRSAFEQQYPNSGATAALYDADGTPNGLAGEYLNRIEAQMGQQRADWLAAHPEQVPDAQTPGVVKPFEDFIFGSPMVGGVVPTSFLALAGLGIGGGAAALAGNSLISVSAPAAFKAAFLDGLPDHISIPDFVPGVGGRDIQTPDAAQHLLGAILDNPTGLLQTASNALTTLLDHPEQFPSQIAGDVKGAFTQSPTEYAVQQGLQDAGVLSLAAGVIGLHNPVSAVQTDGWSGVKDLIANTFQVHNTAKNFEDQVNQAVASGASVQDAVTTATANIHNPTMDFIWNMAPWNPLYEAVTFPVFEEAVKGILTRKTAGAIENLTKRTGDFTAETGASGRAILAERTGANPASALFDTSRQAAAKQLADLQISHLPTVENVAEMPDLVARLFRGAEDIARNPADYRYARAVAQQIADWSGGTAEGNLAHMKAIVVGETKSLLDQNAPGLFNRTVDRLAPVAEVLARKAAALEEGGGLSTRQIAEAAWGARLATSDPRALGLAARKLVADDITAAWYAHAGVDLPGTETQLARAYNGLFSLTRSLLLAGAAPPLALQKFTDEYGRAAIRGVFGIRAADTGLGQAGASFLADRGVGRAAAFRDGGTVRQLLDAGIAPDEALLRGQRAPYGIANAFTGTNRYGELMTKMDRAAALAGSLPRALDKWNQSLISAPTQHVMLNAAYQDLKGLAPARERLAAQAMAAIGTRTGDWAAADAAGSRLARARSEEQFLREAAAIDAKYPGLGVTKAAEPTVPVRNIAQGRAVADINRTERGLPRAVADARGHGLDLAAGGDGGAGRVSRQFKGNYAENDLNAAGGFGTGRTLDRYESMKGAPRSGPQAANDAAARIQRDAMDQHLNQSGTLDAYLDTLKANRNLDEVRAAGVGVNTEISNAEHFLAAAKSPADEARAAHDLAEFTKARREIGTLREELQPGYVSGASKEPTFGPAPRSATAADAVKARMDELGIQPTVPSTMRTPGIGKNADLRHDFAGYEGTVDPTQQFGRPAAADPTQAFGTPASFAPIQRNPFGPAERAAVTPASNGAGDITRQLGRQFATEQRGAAAAGVARGRSIVGNPLDQTTAGAFLKNGAGIIPPILPFAPFHIHSTQFWAGYFASHPAMALGIANAVAGLDDYGTLHLPGGATVGNLIKLTTGAHLVEWAKKAYEYQMDVARQGNNNPLQQVLKGIAYNTAGNNAFVRPFEWAGTPLEGFAQSHTNPLVTGKQNYDGTAQVDPRDVYRQSGGMTGLEGALQLANGRLGEPLPRNAVGAIGNPGKLLGNATQAGVNRLVGATIKQSDFGAQLPYFAPGFKEQQGWDLPRTQQAVKDALSGKPSSPDGRALLDAYNHNRDLQAVAKLAPVQLGQDEAVKPIYPPFEKPAGFGTHSPNLPGSLYVNRQEWPQTRGFDSAQTNTAYGLLRSSDPGVVQSGADYLKQHGATIPARFDVTNMNDIDAQQIRQGRLDAQLRTDTQLGHPALNTDLGGGFTARDLLNQKGNYYATDKLLQDAYASGDKAAIARYTADLARIKAADIQQAPGLADYFKGLKENYAATHPDAPKPFRDTLAPNEQDAWDAFNDLRNSADYKARNSLEDQASGLTKGTKEYTDWFKKNGDELTRLNNIVNAGEQSILDLHGANPKELQNRLARSEGKPATYPDTTIPGQKAPFTPTPSSGSGARTPASSTSSRSGTGTSGSRAATTNRSPSGTTGRTNNSRTGSGSGGGSSSRPAAADAGTQFYSEYRNLTPQEKAVARNDPRVRDVIGAKGVTPAQFAQASQALADLATKKSAPGGQTPRTAPQDASTGYRNLGGGYLRDADILAGRGADISRQIAEGHIPAGLLEAAMAHTAGGDPTTAARYAYDLQQRYGSPRPAAAPKGKRPQAA